MGVFMSKSKNPWIVLILIILILLLSIMAIYFYWKSSHRSVAVF